MKTQKFKPLPRSKSGQLCDSFRDLTDFLFVPLCRDLTTILHPHR
jgi:hypothetical protein